MIIDDFPKLFSPFAKVNHRVIPEITPGYEWVFNDPGVKAVDKLHGTNLSVRIRDGQLKAIYNRTNCVLDGESIPITGNTSKFVIGVLNACNKGWLQHDGVHYGELIGPDINKNMHLVRDYLFVPFDYLASKHHWQSWLKGTYPKDYQTISDWFRDLLSLFTKHVVGVESPAEGLVFHHPDGRMAKLRRDMFPWYQGERHKE